MALGVINGTTSNDRIISKIEWESWLDSGGVSYKPQSYVHASLWLKRTNTGYKTHGSGTFKIIIGSQTFTESGDFEIEDEWVCIMVVLSEAIKHDADGKKSIKISASGSMPATTLTSVSCSKTVELDNYQSASTFTLSGNGKTSAGNVYVTADGVNTLKVTIDRQSASYKHDVDYYIGSKLVAEYTGITTGHSPKISPATWFPNITDRRDTTGLSNANAPSVKVTTYDADGIKIGSTVSKRFDIYIPDSEDTQPKVEIDSIKPVSSLSSPFNALYIQGLSKVQAEITAEGKYGAKISSCNMKVNGETYDADDDYTSEYFSGYGNTTVKVTAKDSRGISKSVEETINVLPYTKPMLITHSAENKIICARCDKDGYLKDSGTYLKIKAGRSYQPLTDNGVQNNFCQIQYRYKTDGGEYSSWKTILAKTAASDEIDTEPLLEGALLANTSYAVQVRAIDDVNRNDTKTFNIPTDKVFRHKRIGGKGLGLGTYCERDNLFVVSEDWDCELRGNVEVGGGSGIHTLRKGIQLSEGANLDDYKTPGNYYSPNATVSASISGTPYTDGGFGLKVGELQSENYIYQELYYGRTRWIRHYNGEEWSGFVRFLMTSEKDSFAVDFPIEIGNSNGWSYRKWKSGAFDMGGIFNVTATEAGTAKGVMYYSEQFKLPAPFKINAAIVSGTATEWFVVITGGLSNGDDGEDPKENIGFRLLRPVSFAAGQTSSVRLYVTGTYTT